MYCPQHRPDPAYSHYGNKNLNGFTCPGCGRHVGNWEVHHCPGPYTNPYNPPSPPQPNPPWQPSDKRELSEDEIERIARRVADILKKELK